MTEQAKQIVHRIRDWDRHYEKSQSRKVGNVQWVALPVKHDGLGYRRLMANANGTALYGAWVLMVQVAAKCPKRGVLADEHGPFDAHDLALKTGGDAEVFEAALKLVSSPQIGWMVAEYQLDAIALSLQDNTRQDITEQDNESTYVDSCGEFRDGGTSPLSVFVFPTVGTGAKTWTLPQAKLEQYVDSYPGLDVPEELRKARQWCEDRPKRRKTPNGMPAFLTGWMNRAQDSRGGKATAQTARSGKNYVVPDLE